MASPELSVVIPIYNEEDCITELIGQLTTVLDQLKTTYEVIFVDDGSSDNSVQMLRSQAQSSPNFKLLVHSYNQGKPTTLTTGLSHASGDYILLMDPDLQDPPEEIPNFLNKAKQGNDLVFGVRDSKKGTLFEKMSSAIFWTVLNKLTGLNLPRNLAVMRIVNKTFLQQFLKYSEANRFIEGIFAHVGMNQTTLTIPHRDRFAGKSKYTLKKKMELAINAMIDFTDFPMRLTVRFGAALTAFSIVALLGIVLARLFVMEFQVGWPSLFSILLFGFGIVIFFLGVIGRYVGNIYKETKNRPLFSIKERVNF